MVKFISSALTKLHFAFICVLLLSVVNFAFAKTKADEARIEFIGDAIMTAIPFVASIPIFIKDDKEGSMAFLKSLVASCIATGLLKEIMHKKRPNGSNFKSFPSGHTSLAFHGASFLYFKYGWMYGVPAAIAATYVGFSRVYARKHYIDDVIAGAILGITSTYYFIKPYSTQQSKLSHEHLGVFAHDKQFGLYLSKTW